MANSFTLEDYLPPQWSAEPSYNFYFEVIKDGCVLGKLPIKRKPFNLVGRLEELCDVPIDNQTVSRKHAILQAKTDEPSLYLYDLGSAHGTFVNKERLPARTYKRLAPFDSLKFGVSSRAFVLRCPEYEEVIENQQTEKDNSFAEMIQAQHRQISKEQLKERYLDLLENDPYFAANQAPRRLAGRQQEEEDEYEGIDWGISDQREVYGQRQDNDMPIEPDLLRRLPLEQPQLNKLADYEEHLRKYQEVESELNELAAREKREFGLEEKLQAKKEKLEKRFVQALEAVEKLEDWLRVNIFGQTTDRDKKNVAKVKEKQNDTFGDDEYLDRTLQNNRPIDSQQQADISTEDYWRLEKELKEASRNLEEIKQKLTLLQQAQVNRGGAMQQQEEDDLDAFMKHNDNNLDNENIAILRRQEQILVVKIQQLQARFRNAVGEEQLSKVTASSKPIQQGHRTLKEDFKEKSLEESIMQAKRRMEHNQTIEGILNRLEAASGEEQEVNELDPAIFNYYKGKERQHQEEEDDGLDEDKLTSKKRYDRDYNPQKFQKPVSKHVNFSSLDRRQPPQEQEEEVIDLTRGQK